MHVVELIDAPRAQPWAAQEHEEDGEEAELKPGAEEFARVIKQQAQRAQRQNLNAIARPACELSEPEREAEDRGANRRRRGEDE